MHEYVCEDCGGHFVSERSNEDAHAEAIKNFGVSGHHPGMAQICDDCYKNIIQHPEYEPVAALFLLEELKKECIRRGYQLEVNETETRLIRPDGTLALIARR